MALSTNGGKSVHLFYRDDLGVDCISAAGQNLLILISADTCWRKWSITGSLGNTGFCKRCSPFICCLETSETG